jgi:hypothetical protein
MSIGMNIALMVALALAATGISTQHQAGVSNSATGGRGQNLNHNETLVRDTTTSPRAGDPGPLAVEQSVTSQLFTMFSLYRIGSCSHWHCNHNETLVRASASM